MRILLFLALLGCGNEERPKAEPRIPHDETPLPTYPDPIPEPTPEPVCRDELVCTEVWVDTPLGRCRVITCTTKKVCEEENSTENMKYHTSD